jgi:hypothetical protein
VVLAFKLKPRPQKDEYSGRTASRLRAGSNRELTEKGAPMTKALARLLPLLFLASPGCVTVDPWQEHRDQYDAVAQGRLDLEGLSRGRVERMLGPPRYRATLSSPRTRGETWTYMAPGSAVRIQVIFEQDAVTRVEVFDKLQDGPGNAEPDRSATSR